jgi:hypothetical protein
LPSSNYLGCMYALRIRFELINQEILENVRVLLNINFTYLQHARLQ